jgi:uncharacterized membrane protein
MEPKKTSTGLEENVAGLLCYVAWWVSGVVFLIIEPDNKFIRFHALQSIVVFGVLTLAWAILRWIPFIGDFISGAIWFIGAALWIALMITAYQGRKYKLPWSGDLAERWANR